MKKLFWVLSMASILIISCNKDDDNNGDDDTSTDVINDYSGSGAKGDLITFAINQTQKTYTVHNETTNTDNEGTYSVMSGNFNGIYKVTANSGTFFAVEVADEILAANFPTGNSDNNISFGVSSSLSYLNNSTNITGDYTWIIMCNKEIDGSTSNKEWGVMTVKSDGTWIKKNYKGGSGYVNPGYLSPDLFNETLPLASGDETGTWEVNGTHQERLNVSINGTSGTLTGYVYGDANSAAFLLDLGTGNGFLLGIKNTNVTLSQIAGNYSFVDVWNTGYKGAGNYNINSSGSVTWNHVTTSDLQESGSFSLAQCSYLKNTYYTNNASIGGYNVSVYCVICGDLIMHFFFNNTDGGFIAYGAGGKI
ncbi:MAG: hypothetical protein JXB49_37390 [Bacteroidales bacterium]|nr:hypothetical protein [Bacteroidales bacterium]